MKKYIIRLIFSIVLLLLFGGLTTYELIKTSRLDKQVLSTSVSFKCHKIGGIKVLPYKCKQKYTFKKKGKKYTCYKKGTYFYKKKDFDKHELIFFSNKKPTKCSVGEKSSNLLLLVFADIISIVLFIVSLIIFRRRKKKYEYEQL